MKKHVFWVVVFLAVWCCGMGYAQDNNGLMELLLSPHEAVSLNMVQPFAPVKMDLTAFDQGDRAFLQSLGLDESDCDDIAGSGAVTWRGADDAGREAAVVFCGAYGEYGFVFLPDASGTVYLTDVLLGCCGAQAGASIVTMANGIPYLLTEAWGHGSGSERWWTRWYNLNGRRMELSYLRRGTEAGYQAAAQAVTATSMDGELRRVTDPGDRQYLVTYTYTALVTFAGAQSDTVSTGDTQCIVRVYEAAQSGMRLVKERTFAGASPAVMQTLSVELLLSDSLTVAP